MDISPVQFSESRLQAPEPTAEEMSARVGLQRRRAAQNDANFWSLAERRHLIEVPAYAYPSRVRNA